MDRARATPAPEPSSLPDWLSALADGQLAGDELQQALDALGAEPAGQAHRAHWHTVHLIGEVLRHGPAPATPHDELFLARLRVRLQAEAAGRLPEPAREPHGVALPDAPEKVANYPYSTEGNARFDPKKPAANDPGFRWRLAGLASVAAVALIGWSMGPGGWGASGPRGAAEWAAAAPDASTSAAALPVAPMLRDPRLDALLAAHRQLGGASALQQPSGFLRNATFEGERR